MTAGESSAAGGGRGRGETTTVPQPPFTEVLLELGARVEFERYGKRYVGKIAAVQIPTDDLDGSRELARDRALILTANSYSGSICREHQRPAPRYEGSPHIAPTRPHYDIVADRCHFHVCACAIVAGGQVALF